MKITLLAIGKTDDKDLQRLITVYSKRLSHYVSFTAEMLPDIKNSKNLSEEQQKQLEGQEILKRITTSDQLILLDENGKNYSSEGFAQFLQKKMNSGLKQLIFVIGGPYGFSPELYQRANGKISLSSMTFSHQMVRLFFVEQL
ncbi:MAG TPA: 23S rRNA (pseudouridine(1915)-N(3))-methyltransferase RlmH, partial [Flavobacteriaceae bacterium]|nr:23S rRNA (pseudouridine(1915)-N(3))-methyltransferase RlmH [Flavobacteriaceae bacterium]